MVQLTLASGEAVDVELPCDDTLAQITARAIGGNCKLHVQSTRDGRTFTSYHVSTQLTSEKKVVKFRLPERTRKIRLFVENAAASRAAHVEIDDEPTQDQPTPEIVSGTSADSASN